MEMDKGMMVLVVHGMILWTSLMKARHRLAFDEPCLTNYLAFFFCRPRWPADWLEDSDTLSTMIKGLQRHDLPENEIVLVVR